MTLTLRGGPQDQTLVGVEGQIRKNLVIQVALSIVAACIDAQTFVCISSGGPAMDPDPGILGDGPFAIHLKIGRASCRESVELHEVGSILITKISPYI